jgi:two-component SAPR family response regulator
MDMMATMGRVLVVEDDGLLALALKETLTAVGYDVVGPAPTTKKALKLIETETIDAAILDVNLGSERIDSVAQALADSEIPFVFSTGYCNKSALPPAFVDQTTLSKPYQPDQLLKVIGQLMSLAQAERTASSGTVSVQ